MVLEEYLLCDQKRVAGLDEAGRGCLAGPVTAAAVILPPKFNHPLLNDSKKMGVEEREDLRIIIEEEALAWAVAFVSPARIDQINILWASIEAMHLALDQLSLSPQHLLVDGNRFRPYKEIPFECVVRGDGKFTSIAAASVLAKTHRDAYMIHRHDSYPMYGWKSNKGYPTREHREGIRIHGPCKLHRQSFKLIPEEQLSFWSGSDEY